MPGVKPGPVRRATPHRTLLRIPAIRLRHGFGRGIAVFTEMDFESMATLYQRTKTSRFLQPDDLRRSREDKRYARAPYSQALTPRSYY